MQAQGARDFTIYPAGERQRYAVVSHIQPFTTLNRSVLGYDLLSDPMRRQTSLRAASLAQSALTPAVTLVQDLSGSAEPGLILLQPVYRSGTPLVSAEQKLQALKYFVYAAFRVRDLLTALWPAQRDSGLAFRWSALTQGAEKGMLYQSLETETASPFQQQIQLDLFGQPFVLDVHAPSSFINQHMPHTKLFELVAALLFTLLVFVTLSLLNLRRYQAILLQQQLSQQLQWQHQQLLANEQRQALVLKASRLVWFEFNLPTGEAFYSDSCWRLLGYQRPLSSASQQLLTDAMSAQDALQFQHDVQLLIATTIEDFNQHYYLTNRQGQSLYCRLQLYLWRDQAGDALSLFGIMSDQTLWLQQQTTLQQQSVLSRYNLRQAMQLTAEVANQLAFPSQSELQTYRQLQWLHQQDLIRFLSRLQVDSANALSLQQEDRLPAADAMTLIESLWPLFVQQQQAQSTQLHVGHLYQHKPLCCAMLPLRQYLSLILEAGCRWAVADAKLVIEWRSIAQAELLELQFEVNAELLPQLLQWQQRADDWLALPATEKNARAGDQDDDLLWLPWSCQFWASLMNAHFSLHIQGSAASDTAARPLCQLQLRFHR
jgi:PAS domain-containing protein